MTRIPFLVLFLLAAPLAAQEVPDMAPLAQAWLAHRPAPSAGALDADGARAAQKAFVDLLIPTQGEPVGYKAALTSGPAQQRFGVDHPLRGTLLAKMLLPSGRELGLDVGARPLFEGDLIVRVGDEALNEARDREHALAALDAVLPFLEIPDLVYAADVAVDGPALTAINAGARAGIVGGLIPLRGDGWAQRLADLEVVLLGDAGEELARGRGVALLGHPLDAVLWLRDSLAADGIRLKKGDLLSLGSLTPLLPARPGKVTARYTGLGEEPVEITVTFRAP